MRGPVVGTCPDLDDPTETVVDALEEAARSDAESAEWVKDLDRHYEDLDVCRGARATR